MSRAKHEAKSVVTKLTNKALDFKPFDRVLIPGSGGPTIKIVGNNQGDIDLAGNKVTVYDYGGGGKQTLDVGSGKYYVRDSLEVFDVGNLTEKKVSENFPGEEEEGIPMAGAPKRMDQGRKPGFLRNLFGKKPGMGEPNPGVREAFGEFDFDFGGEDEEEGDSFDEPSAEGGDEFADDTSDEFSDAEFAGDEEEGDEDIEPVEMSDEIPDEEQEIIGDIQAAVDQLIDFENDEHEGEGGDEGDEEGADEGEEFDMGDEEGAGEEEEEEEETEKEMEERLLKRDLSSFLGEEEGTPKNQVKAMGITNPQASPNSKVGQPQKPKEDGGDGEGIETEKNTSVTNPKSSNGPGKPKDGIEGHDGEMTKQVDPSGDETMPKNKGPASNPGLAGERVEGIRADLNKAITLIERGIDPHTLSSRVLKGSSGKFCKRGGK